MRGQEVLDALSSDWGRLSICSFSNGLLHLSIGLPGDHWYAHPGDCVIPSTVRYDWEHETDECLPVDSHCLGPLMVKDPPPPASPATRHWARLLLNGIHRRLFLHRMECGIHECTPGHCSHLHHSSPKMTACLSQVSVSNYPVGNCFS